ncbi:unnamed protein product [Closterium sp. NIES-53]
MRARDASAADGCAGRMGGRRKDVRRMVAGRTGVGCVGLLRLHVCWDNHRLQWRNPLPFFAGLAVEADGVGTTAGDMLIEVADETSGGAWCGVVLVVAGTVFYWHSLSWSRAAAPWTVDTLERRGGLVATRGGRVYQAAGQVWCFLQHFVSYCWLYTVLCGGVCNINGWLLEQQRSKQVGVSWFVAASSFLDAFGVVWYYAVAGVAERFKQQQKGIFLQPLVQVWAFWLFWHFFLVEEQGVPSNGSQQVFSTCYRSVWAFWCFLHFFKVLCGAVWWIRSRVFRATAVSGSSQPVTGQCGRFGASNVSEVLCGTVWWGGSGRVFQATAASGSSQPASGHCGRFGAFNVPFWCCAVLCGGAMWGASSVYSVQGSGAVWCSVVEGEERNGSSSLQPSSGRRVSESATSNFNRSVSSKTQIRECTGRGG